ncbi:hypothetical protein ACJX0J_009415, partial [Zea mays]
MCFILQWNNFSPIIQLYEITSSSFELIDVHFLFTNQDAIEGELKVQDGYLGATILFWYDTDCLGHIRVKTYAKRMASNQSKNPSFSLWLLSHQAVIVPGQDLQSN